MKLLFGACFVFICFLFVMLSITTDKLEKAYERIEDMQRHCICIHSEKK